MNVQQVGRVEIGFDPQNLTELQNAAAFAYEQKLIQNPVDIKQFVDQDLLSRPMAIPASTAASSLKEQ